MTHRHDMANGGAELPPWFYAPSRWSPPPPAQGRANLTLGTLQLVTDALGVPLKLGLGPHEVARFYGMRSAYHRAARAIEAVTVGPGPGGGHDG